MDTTWRDVRFIDKLFLRLTSLPHSFNKPIHILREKIFRVHVTQAANALHIIKGDLNTPEVLCPNE